MAQILSGTELAQEIRRSLTDEIIELKKAVPKFTPHLTIVQVGNREDSNVYIRNKIIVGSEIGVKCTHLRLPQTITESELLPKIEQLNKDRSVHGIIVQMPLDTNNEISSHKVTDSISSDKDVDGLNSINQGKLCVGNLTGMLPCTPSGILELIKRTGITIAGSRAVVIGRSRIVGSPVAELLKWNDATVTVCHSHTVNLNEHISVADILVVAIGKAEYIRGDWIKPGAVVIDCGINAIPDPQTDQYLVGDVAFKEACKVAGYITPVPGGVGPLTVAMLMKNTVKAAKIFAMNVK